MVCRRTRVQCFLVELHRTKGPMWQSPVWGGMLSTFKEDLLFCSCRRQRRYTRVHLEVSRLSAWSENCKWYSSLPLGAVVSLFCEFCRHKPLCCFSMSVYCCLSRFWIHPRKLHIMLINIAKYHLKNEDMISVPHHFTSSSVSCTHIQPSTTNLRKFRLSVMQPSPRSSKWLFSKRFKVKKWR
jgi:hypothetical protein